MYTQRIIPAIIPDSYDSLERRLRDLRGVSHRIQVDVLDGTYTPSVSWPYAGAVRDDFEASLRTDAGLPFWQDFSFEVDLMVMRPEEKIASWSLSGVACLIIHVESTTELSRIITVCHERRIEVALALKPGTAIERIAPYVETISFVQCMGSRRIGYNGVELEEDAVEMVRMLNTRWPKLVVGIDIGVNDTTLERLVAAGARRFAAGSAIFSTPDPASAFRALEAKAVAVIGGE